LSETTDGEGGGHTIYDFEAARTTNEKSKAERKRRRTTPKRRRRTTKYTPRDVEPPMNGGETRATRI